MLLKRLAKIVCTFALLLAIAYMTGKIGLAAYKRYLVKVKINELQAQVGTLEARNEQIASFLKNLENPEYLLLKTKEQFNLKETGENVAAVNNPQDAGGENSSNKYSLSSDTKPAAEEKPLYWKKWITFFFGN